MSCLNYSISKELPKVFDPVNSIKILINVIFIIFIKSFDIWIPRTYFYRMAYIFAALAPLVFQCVFVGVILSIFLLLFVLLRLMELGHTPFGLDRCLHTAPVHLPSPLLFVHVTRPIVVFFFVVLFVASFANFDVGVKLALAWLQLEDPLFQLVPFVCKEFSCTFHLVDFGIHQRIFVRQSVNLSLQVVHSVFVTFDQICFFLFKLSLFVAHNFGFFLVFIHLILHFREVHVQHLLVLREFPFLVFQILDLQLELVF